MLRLRQMKSLQKFASVHPNVHHHFSFERNIVDRKASKERPTGALADLRQVAA